MVDKCTIYTMALNIKNAEVERLVTEVARMAGESKTEAIRQAMQTRKQKLEAEGKGDRITELKRWLREEYWPSLPQDALGKGVPREEIDALYE